MHQVHAKRSIMGLGLGLGFLGLCILGFAIQFLRSVRHDHGPFETIAVLFGPAVALYLFALTYLIWFRATPRVVRHVCGVWTYLIVLVLTQFLVAVPILLAVFPILLVFMVGLAFLAHRVASRGLNRALFTFQEAPYLNASKPDGS